MYRQPGTSSGTESWADSLLDSDSEAVGQLALRPREAARALGIGERLLWSLTNRGEIPHLKLGRATLYPVEDLRRWLSEKANKGLRR